MYESKIQPRGFIALMSAIIISAILLIVVASGSLTGFFGRMNIFDSELKERSMNLADACIDQAILKLAQNTAYTGSETITLVGGDTCTIGSIPSASPKTFKTQGVFRNYYTNLQVTLTSDNRSVSSWQEVPN